MRTYWTDLWSQEVLQGYCQAARAQMLAALKKVKDISESSDTPNTCYPRAAKGELLKRKPGSWPRSAAGQ